MQLLRQGKIFISDSGFNDDKFRKPISRIIVHHTHSRPAEFDIDNAEYLEMLNSLHLIRLFAFYASQLGEELYGKPIYSGHYYKGKQTFICYHWVIFENGEVVQVNQDESLVWHSAGANANSVGLCFVGDFSELKSRPNLE
ncbi:MAG: N-acetylmuramoyl-L-alanine amidase [Patescibacteria group bacterium]